MKRGAGQVTAVMLMLAAHGLARAADARRGAELYEQRCAACHSPEADRVGPRHNGVLGRRAGSVAGFAYSRALAQAKFVWTAQRLDAWLANPERLVPGQAMGYSVSDPQDRADLIVYLGTLSATRLSRPSAQ